MVCQRYRVVGPDEQLCETVRAVSTLMRRLLMAAEPGTVPSTPTSGAEKRPRKSRAKVVKPGRLAVSEFAADKAGASSPFGDDVIFPLPVEALSYEHPTD
jgi:hypothetical protein